MLWRPVMLAHSSLDPTILTLRGATGPLSSVRGTCGCSLNNCTKCTEARGLEESTARDARLPRSTHAVQPWLLTATTPALACASTATWPVFRLIETTCMTEHGSCMYLHSSISNTSSGNATKAPAHATLRNGSWSTRV